MSSSGHIVEPTLQQEELKPHPFRMRALFLEGLFSSPPRRQRTAVKTVHNGAERGCHRHKWVDEAGTRKHHAQPRVLHPHFDRNRAPSTFAGPEHRSEERRVGKERSERLWT